jgi:uncharacterized Zn-finger protein
VDKLHRVMLPALSLNCRSKPMALTSTPKFHNEAGVPAIQIGTKEFKCIGAKPPLDHPHIYIDMGHEDEAICPYCSTVYRYDAALAPAGARPAGALFSEDAG